MKKLFRKIEKVEKKIHQKLHYINDVDNSEYYRVFGSETEKFFDKAFTYNKITKLENKRIELLTILKTKIENEISNHRAF